MKLSVIAAGDEKGNKGLIAYFNLWECTLEWQDAADLT